ncbi:hypothetical protein HYW74_03475 [Candidatus Pacearchaeota archaeon]|nr:hypothetical protein [Candidatus Pacearchaeota archaeon]
MERRNYELIIEKLNQGELSHGDLIGLNGVVARIQKRKGGPGADTRATIVEQTSIEPPVISEAVYSARGKLNPNPTITNIKLGEGEYLEYGLILREAGRWKYEGQEA